MYVAVNEKGEVKKELKGNWWGEERRREEHDYIMYMYICTYCCKKNPRGLTFICIYGMLQYLYCMYMKARLERRG